MDLRLDFVGWYRPEEVEECFSIRFIGQERGRGGVGDLEELVVVRDTAQYPGYNCRLGAKGWTQYS